MTTTPQANTATSPALGLRVSIGAATYPAEEIARGAAYQVFSPHEEVGFTRGSRGWYRFVHATEVSAIHGPGQQPDHDSLDQPLCVPLSRTRSWHDIHRLTQSARATDPTLATIRRTATIRRGSRMVKVLSAHQASGYLHGWLPSGFCYRAYDIAHLRTPAELRLLRTDQDSQADTDEVAFVLRWRAVDGSDYEVPTADRHPGLVAMPPHDRVGAPVLGTGFTPSDHHVIPEFVTTDLADLPLPSNASLLAYTADGTEVVLYTYQPEQRGWLRMVGPQWRHLLQGLGGPQIDREYVPVADTGQGSSRLVGWFRGQEYETVADPPDDFRLLARSRAARYPVEALVRRTRYANWRGVRCMVIRDDGAWIRVRLCRPDQEQVAMLGAHCLERGVYETWAPTGEVTDRITVDHPYPL